MIYLCVALAALLAASIAIIILQYRANEADRAERFNDLQYWIAKCAEADAKLQLYEYDSATTSTISLPLFDVEQVRKIRENIKNSKQS